MKLLKLFIAIVVAATIAGCSGNNDSPKPAGDSLAVAAADTVKPAGQDMNSVDLSNVPDDVRPMLKEIQVCLAAAVDNSTSSEEGIALMKKCEQSVRDKFKAQLAKDPKFEKYFNEQGQQIYNIEKIRLKQKYSK